MPEPAAPVNPIVVQEAHAAFLQFLPALSLLQSKSPAAIPSGFLLDDVAFKNAYPPALAGAGPSRVPWHDGYGRLFWCRYLPADPAKDLCTPKGVPSDLRRALVPLDYDLASIVTSLSLPDGTVLAKAFLYPWGIGLLLDVTLHGPLPLAAAVNRLQEIRNRNRIAWQMGADSGSASPAVLANEIRTRLGKLVYGDQPTGEDACEPFSLVTVTDAANVVYRDPIEPNGPIHCALDGLTTWDRNWSDNDLKPELLTTLRIDSKSGPAGHILYGRPRSRAVWFPREFAGAKTYKGTLSCYHQNLSVASLQTEALSVLAKDAAGQIAQRQSLAGCSVTYRNCAQIAAGVLGRLYSKRTITASSNNPPPYRSGSVRAQIADTAEQVNRLRTFFSMGPLEE